MSVPIARAAAGERPSAGGPAGEPGGDPRAGGPNAIASTARVRIRVTGTVQGVGFRPFCFRLAEQLGLTGWVRNDERGVLLEAEGAADRLERLPQLIRAEAPALAELEDVEVEAIEPSGDTGFEIVETDRAGSPDALVSPDTATCEACLAELLDPADRRYRYPFTNCTDCGPRFTIVRGVPYDRALTTMAGFEMCPACRGEYEDPRDRRFHAQPNACHACGPGLELRDAARRPMPLGGALDPLAAAAALLLAGRILAVKGLGGYHLACRADDEAAVAELRSRKHRDEKPFALLVGDLEAAERIVELTGEERELISGRERPIVIAARRAPSALRPPGAIARSVAPGSAELGVMLPYSPLHHLLARDAGVPLVLTSGNVSDEPIAFTDADAAERLGPIADALLVGERPIHIRTDDSVVRSLGAASGRPPLLMRRSRGYVPRSIGLPVAAERPLLACGAELKSTFCLARGSRAWVGHHIGDLGNWETLRSFREGVDHFERLFAVRPEVVAHDLHSDYLSTRYALERDGVEHVAVQHHHAHLAACLAEHGERGPAVGAILDGAGLGPDGSVWGGEVLVGDLAGSERAAALNQVRLPGGDAAAREPWRMACAWLVESLREPEPEIPQRLAAEVDPAAWRTVCRLAGGVLDAPLTTSAGRLFDAVAALCGLRARTSYEGQAATLLEAISDPREIAAYPMPMRIDADAMAASGAPPALLDARETIAALLADLERGAEPPRVAARFHNALAHGVDEACAMAAEQHGLSLVVLSGGVFQNRLLVTRTAEALEGRGLRVLVPELLPPNDGGIAYGQANVAAAIDERGRG